MSTGELAAAYHGHFNTFLNQHQNEELRLAAARSLIDPLAEQPDFSQGGHRFLVAHWGEELPDLEHIGASMYYRKGNANRAYINETDRRHAIAITEGSADMVLNSEPELSGPVSLEMGLLANSDLYNEFGGRLQAAATHCRGVQAPYLNFRQSFLVTGYQRLYIGPDGDIWVSPIPRDFDESYVKALEAAGATDDEEDAEVEPEVCLPKLAAYMGTVSLAGDRQLYQRTKNLVERELIFGNTAAHELIKALAQKASLRAKFAFAALERSGVIVPGYPLPALADIFGRRAKVSEPLIPTGL